MGNNGSFNGTLAHSWNNAEGVFEVPVPQGYSFDGLDAYHKLGNDDYNVGSLFTWNEPQVSGFKITKVDGNLSGKYQANTVQHTIVYYTPIEKPVVNKPVVEKPVVEKPVVNKPVVNKPVVNKPVVNKPVVEKPVAEKPVAEKPVVNKPVVEKPVAEKPVVEKPVVEKPTVEKPVVEKPVRNELPQTGESHSTNWLVSLLATIAAFFGLKRSKQ